MKKIVGYSLSLVVLFLFYACESENANQEVEANITLPKELVAPKGAFFDYLLFENGFDHIPEGDNPDEYTEEIRRSGKYSFALSNEREFSPSYSNSIEQSMKGKWLKISFDCFKEKTDVDPKERKTYLVLSCQESATDSMLHYAQFSLYELLRAENKQFVEKWENLTVWYPLPDDLKLGDKLKIYHWNPKGGNIYLDNYKIEVWATQSPKAPANYYLSHGIAEQNYESPSNGHTKETAARGIGSQVISAKNQFGTGYEGTLEASNIAKEDYVRIVFSALKHDKVVSDKKSASMVVVLRNEQFFYESYFINPRIREQGEQVSGKWVTLEQWVKIPPSVQPQDELKIYTFNPYEMPIYIDDLRVEVWKPKPSE